MSTIKCYWLLTIPFYVIVLLTDSYHTPNWLSTKEILRSKPFGCNYFVIIFNEFTDKLLWKNSIDVILIFCASPFTERLTLSILLDST